MENTAYVTTDMNLFNRWLSDLAGTAVETHLRRRRSHGDRPQDAIVARAEEPDNTDHEQFTVMSGSTSSPY